MIIMYQRNKVKNRIQL